jgi:hypothetical protein
MDLGKKFSIDSLATPASSDSPESKVSYPGFSLSDDVAEQFLKDSEAKVGDEFAATVRIKVTGLSDDQIGKNVRFDVLELDDVTEESDDEGSGSGSGSGESAPESDDEEAVLGYKRKKTEKETPDISAKSLQD